MTAECALYDATGALLGFREVAVVVRDGCGYALEPIRFSAINDGVITRATVRVLGVETPLKLHTKKQVVERTSVITIRMNGPLFTFASTSSRK